MFYLIKDCTQYIDILSKIFHISVDSTAYKKKEHFLSLIVFYIEITMSC